MNHHRESFSLLAMCRVFGVSRGGFYSWLRAGHSRRKRFELRVAIREIFYESDESYGNPRVYRELRARGIKACKSSVEKIMRTLGFRGKKRRRFKVTTDSKHSFAIAPNLVNRSFDRGAKNVVWLSDITYLRLKEGFGYLAAVMDAHTRKIVGFKVSDHMRDELVCDALASSYFCERPPKNLLIHSDRGSQYASETYRKQLTSYGMIQSMSRKANCWDNAPMESFFDSLKTELISKKVFETIDEAKSSIFEWIEIFYNKKRLHSALGYVSPACFEQRIMAKAA